VIQDRQEAKSMITGDVSEGGLRSVNDLGLAGYLDIVHSQDSDLLDVALGTDLTSFGFPAEAIESSSALYPTFLSPWSDVPAKKEAEHLIAPCYYISPPFPAPSDRMSKFSDETLFYIFYAMPRDFMQEWAVQVLYDRGWRFHKDTKVWLTIDSEAPPTVRTPTYERGTFVYFDISSWEKVKKEFIITPDQLDERPKTRS
jgi:CCR4-NOT transcription complex subunit 2